MIERLPAPAIIAHRGASALAPENTLASFRLAQSLQADALEFDVQLSADNEVIVFHDHKLDRITQVSGTVRTYPAAQLKQLDAGSIYGPAFEGETIPTLREVFEQLPDSLFNIELKAFSLHFSKLISQVHSLISEYGREEDILISSFNPLAVLLSIRHFPELNHGLLMAGRSAHIWAILKTINRPGITSAHISCRHVNRSLIKRFQEQGLKVFVYTVNSPDIIRKLKQWGVDGLFTDDPALARRALSA